MFQRRAASSLIGFSVLAGVTASFLLAGCAGAASGNNDAATSGSTPSGTKRLDAAPRQTFPLER